MEPGLLKSAEWPVLIDVNQIETAFLNIAINARDAMPCGGTLLIETANIDAGSSALPDEMTGRDCVLASMRDTGTGMSPEVAERAFEPFFTTKEIGKGTGLGLSRVFGIVRQSGGMVRLTSRIREGTIPLPPRGGRSTRSRSTSRPMSSLGSATSTPSCWRTRSWPARRRPGCPPRSPGRARS